MRRVIVEEHNPTWQVDHARECEQLRSVLEGILLACHHIGSTAIPGICAKPIIDILLVVSSLEMLDERNGDMIALGYLPRGENGISGRRYYRKGSDDLHTHHVHAYALGHPDIERHLAFRDYLRAHPEDAQAYDHLKRELAAHHANDIDSYVNGKDAFIKEMDRRARAWRQATS